MKEYVSTSVIDASPETVWATLADGSRYQQWNAEIVKIERWGKGREEPPARIKPAS